MGYQTLTLEDRPEARIITLARPARFNPLDELAGGELRDALERTGREAGVRVVVLTGAGRAFAAGADLKAAAQALAAGQEAAVDFLGRAAGALGQTVTALRRLPQPVIAALNGVAAGGGLAWALACDLVVASRQARLDPGYLRVALCMDGGLSALLPRLIGLKRASEFFLLGRVLDAATAREWGLCNQVVEPERLLPAALALAGELARSPAAALAAGKALMNRASLGDLETVLEDERCEVMRLAARPEFAEGVRAFVEKRPPRYV